MIREWKEVVRGKRHWREKGREVEGRGGEGKRKGKRNKIA